MAKYLIEVPHESEIVACARAIQVLLSTGSHYLTHADFGCAVGEHKGWLTVEVESEQEARAILPPVFRAQAKVIRLENFTLEQIAEIIAQHTIPGEAEESSGESVDDPAKQPSAQPVRA